MIDDEPGIRKLITLILEDHDVQTAESADQAVSLMEKQSFDVVVSDVKMPGKSGFDLLNELHRMSPGTPVILMTGHAEKDEQIDSCLEKSAAFLAKPFEDDELIEAVESLFRNP